MSFFDRLGFGRRSQRRPIKSRRHHRPNSPLRLECLERRALLSAVPVESVASFFETYGGPGAPNWSSVPVGYSPTHFTNAYGISGLIIDGNSGGGQTIAIVDPNDDPNIFSDLDQFDSQSIPSSFFPAPSYLQAYGAASTFLTVAKLNASNGNPPVPDAAASEEISLDVEWAHAVAPAAKIVLVETGLTSATDGLGDLLNAVDYARNYSGVSVVSMSWGVVDTQTQKGVEFSGENSLDYLFTTPSGHTHVTFVAATGDNGSPATWPAYSPNVVAAGGTSLSTDSAGDYQSETGWSSSGGGVSVLEPQPSYQHGAVTQSSTYRTAPDVSLDSDPNTGVTIYDSYATPDPNKPWMTIAGTSLAAPVWGALFGIANQMRAGKGLAALDGPSQTLPKLYQLPASDLHDVTTGSNGGYSAGTGYDLVTGRGTPIADLLVPDLARQLLLPSSEQHSVVASQVAQSGNLNEQDLFVVGSDGLVREDRYFYATHQATGQAVIDSTTTFNVGTRLTIYNDGTSLNVFAVGQDGKLKWSQQLNGGGWTPFVNLDSLISGSSVAFPASAPIAGCAENGAFELFGVGSDGYVKQYQYTVSNQSWGAGSIIPSPQVTYTPGTSLAVWGFSTGVNMFGVLSDGSIEGLSYSGGWFGYHLSSDAQLAPGTPLAVWQSGANIDLFGVSNSGEVDYIYFDGNWHGGNILTAGANLALHTQLAIYESTNVKELYGINTSGVAVQVQYAGGSWGQGTIFGGYALGSQVSAYVDPTTGAQQIFGPGANSDIVEVEFTYVNGWKQYHLTPSLSPSSEQNSLTASEVAQTGNLTEQDLFVVGSDGLVREDRYFYSSRIATGQIIIDPATVFGQGTRLTVYNDGSSINVFGVGTDGRLKWAQYTGAGGWTKFANLDSFIPGTNIAFPAGAPVVGHSENGLFELYGVGSDGYVKEYQYIASTRSWGSYSINVSPQVTYAPGTSLAIWGFSTGVNMFGVLSDGSIEGLSYSGGWFGYHLSSDAQLAPGTPLAVWQSGSNIDLFGVSNSGEVDYIYFDGNWHGGNILTAGANLALHTQLAIYESTNVKELYGINANGVAVQVQYAGGSWGQGTIFGGYALGSQVSAYVDPTTGTQQIFGLGIYGEILENEFTYAGGWIENNLD